MAVHVTESQTLLMNESRTLHLSDNAEMCQSYGTLTSQVTESQTLLINESRPRICTKPRILVCAPSNAAVDLLVERVLQHKLRDANGEQEQEQAQEQEQEHAQQREGEQDTDSTRESACEHEKERAR